MDPSAAPAVSGSAVPRSVATDICESAMIVTPIVMPVLVVSSGAADAVRSDQCHVGMAPRNCGEGGGAKKGTSEIREKRRNLVCSFDCDGLVILQGNSYPNNCFDLKAVNSL